MGLYGTMPSSAEAFYSGWLACQHHQTCRMNTSLEAGFLCLHLWTGWTGAVNEAVVKHVETDHLFHHLNVLLMFVQ